MLYLQTRMNKEKVCLGNTKFVKIKSRFIEMFYNYHET